MNSLETNLNLNFLRKAYLRKQLSFQRHRTEAIDHFGDALRASVVLGYNWLNKPLFSTYYQFYKLNYNYQDPANSLLISIPQRQETHYVGATFGQQFSRRFYYQLSGSVGRSDDENSLIYFGSIDMEYVLFKQLRLRSHLLYGNVNRLVGNENIKELKLDLFYFY